MNQLWNLGRLGPFEGTSKWVPILGELQKTLQKGEYLPLGPLPMFESNFVQVTHRGDPVYLHHGSNRLTMGVAASLPGLALPDILLIAKPPEDEDSSNLVLTRMIPLGLVHLYVHDLAAWRLKLRLATGRYYYLELDAPDCEVGFLFDRWIRLIHLLHEPATSCAPSAMHLLPPVGLSRSARFASTWQLQDPSQTKRSVTIRKPVLPYKLLLSQKQRRAKALKRKFKSQAVGDSVPLIWSQPESTDSRKKVTAKRSESEPTRDSSQTEITLSERPGISIRTIFSNISSTVNQRESSKAHLSEPDSITIGGYTMEAPPRCVSEDSPDFPSTASEDQLEQDLWEQDIRELMDTTSTSLSSSSFSPATRTTTTFYHCTPYPSLPRHNVKAGPLAVQKASSVPAMSGKSPFVQKVQKAPAVPTSSQKAPFPSQKAPVPSQKAPVPSQKASVPSQKAPVPSQKASVPSRKAPVPSQKAPVPSQKAPAITATSQKASVPSQKASVVSFTSQKVLPVPVPSQKTPVVPAQPQKVPPVPIPSQAPIASVPSQKVPPVPVPSQKPPVVPAPSQKPPVVPAPFQKAPPVPVPPQKVPRVHASSQKPPVGPAPSQKAPLVPAPSQKVPRVHASSQKPPVGPAPSQKAPLVPAPSQKVPPGPAPSKKTPVVPVPSQKAPRVPIILQKATSSPTPNRKSFFLPTPSQKALTSPTQYQGAFSPPTTLDKIPADSSTLPAGSHGVHLLERSQPEVRPEPVVIVGAQETDVEEHRAQTQSLELPFGATKKTSEEVLVSKTREMTLEGLKGMGKLEDRVSKKKQKITVDLPGVKSKETEQQKKWIKKKELSLHGPAPEHSRPLSVEGLALAKLMIMASSKEQHSRPAVMTLPSWLSMNSKESSLSRVPSVSPKHSQLSWLKGPPVVVREQPESVTWMKDSMQHWVEVEEPSWDPEDHSKVSLRSLSASSSLCVPSGPRPPIPLPATRWEDLPQSPIPLPPSRMEAPTRMPQQPVRLSQEPIQMPKQQPVAMMGSSPDILLPMLLEIDSVRAKATQVEVIKEEMGISSALPRWYPESSAPLLEEAGC